MKTQCGTIAYLAPEVRTSKYTSKVDIWSLGVVLYNCFASRYPYDDPNALNNEFRVDFNHEEFENISAAGKKIVVETLQYNAERRPSATQLITERDWLSHTDKYAKKAKDIMMNNPTNSGLE